MIMRLKCNVIVVPITVPISVHVAPAELVRAVVIHKHVRWDALSQHSPRMCQAMCHSPETADKHKETGATWVGTKTLALSRPFERRQSRL